MFTTIDPNEFREMEEELSESSPFYTVGIIVGPSLPTDAYGWQESRYNILIARPTEFVDKVRGYRPQTNLVERLRQARERGKLQ